MVPYAVVRLPVSQRQAVPSVTMRPPPMPADWEPDPNGIHGPQLRESVAWIGVDPRIARLVYEALVQQILSGTWREGGNLANMMISPEPSRGPVLEALNPSEFGGGTPLLSRAGRGPSMSRSSSRPGAPQPYAIEMADDGVGARLVMAADAETYGREGLLAGGLDPNKLVGYGWLPLVEAAGAGHWDVVAALLQGGANPAVT